MVDFRAVDGMQRQEWARSVDLVLAWAGPDDPIYVLGADPGRSTLDYLRARDVDRVVYAKNAAFYEYYFRRRGAGDIADRLGIVEPSAESAGELVRTFTGTGKTVWVLAGHHIQFDEGAVWTLEQAATRHRTAWLYSTIVYEYAF
jgi:hypothetical protein